MSGNEHKVEPKETRQLMCMYTQLMKLSLKFFF